MPAGSLNLQNDTLTCTSSLLVTSQPPTLALSSKDSSHRSKLSSLFSPVNLGSEGKLYTIIALATIYHLVHVHKLASNVQHDVPVNPVVPSLYLSLPPFFFTFTISLSFSPPPPPSLSLPLPPLLCKAVLFCKTTPGPQRHLQYTAQVSHTTSTYFYHQCVELCSMYFLASKLIAFYWKGIVWVWSVSTSKVLAPPLISHQR